MDGSSGIALVLIMCGATKLPVTKMEAGLRNQVLRVAILFVFMELWIHHILRCARQEGMKITYRCGHQALTRCERAPAEMRRDNAVACFQ